LSFWPAHTAVTVDAGGAVSSFQTGDTLTATADDATHQLTVTRNGTVEKTIPMSMGMSAGNHQTPNGTYYVQDKKPSVVMDSSTYGVPVNSTYGYKVTVDLAVRFDNVGDFVHSAPWSVDDQGKRAHQPRLHQHQPHQRQVVLRQLRGGRSDHREELQRWRLQEERRLQRLAELRAGCSSRDHARLSLARPLCIASYISRVSGLGSAMRRPRERMVISAAMLIRERGAHATAISDVLEHSGAT
jgi:hypothetical protein